MVTLPGNPAKAAGFERPEDEGRRFPQNDNIEVDEGNIPGAVGSDPDEQPYSDMPEPISYKPDQALPAPVPKPEAAVTPSPQDEEEEVYQQLVQRRGGEQELQPKLQPVFGVDDLAAKTAYAREAEVAAEEITSTSRSAAREDRARTQRDPDTGEPRVADQPGSIMGRGVDYVWDNTVGFFDRAIGGGEKISTPAAPADSMPAYVKRIRDLETRYVDKIGREIPVVGTFGRILSTPEKQKEWGEGEVARHEQRLKNRAQAVDEAQAALDAWKARHPGQPVSPVLQRRLENAKRLSDKWTPIIEGELKAAKAVAAGAKPGPQLNVYENTANAFGRSVISTGTGAVYSVGFAGGVIADFAGADMNLSENAVMRFADSIDAMAAEIYPQDKQRAEEFATTLAAGFGSALGFYGAGAAGKILGQIAKLSKANQVMLGAAVSGVLGGAVGGAEGVRDAINSARQGREVTNRDLVLAWTLTTLGGTSEAWPIMNWLSSKRGGGALRSVLNQALEEGGQEAFQNMLGNWVAQILHDPERNVMDGVFDAAAVGILTGGTIQAATLPFQGKEAPEAPEDATQRAEEAPAGPQSVQPGATPEAEAPTTTTQLAEGETVTAPTPVQNATEAVEDKQDVKAEPFTPEAGAATVPREIVTPDGSMTVPVEYVVVDRRELQRASGQLQPRDTSRAERAIKAREIAANYDIERMMPSRVSDQGPSTIHGNVIVSGNTRDEAHEIIYTDPQFAETANVLRQRLGVTDPNAQPVLVARIKGDMEEADLVRFADLSNRSSIQQMSATERATRDARAAGSDVMQLYRGGSFESPQNREFLKAFVGKAVTSSERGSMARNGRLTKEGEERLRSAVIAASYGDPDALGRMLESTDDNIRAISGAMLDVTGLIQQLKASVARGETAPEFDISDQIAEAARTISEMRARGERPAEILAQEDAFTQLDPIVEALVRGFYNEELTRAVSRKKMTELLTLYLEEAQRHSGQEGLIPDETTPEDVLAYSYERARGAGADLFAESESATGAADAGDGRGIAGQPAPGGGQAAGTEADVNVNTEEFAAKWIPRQAAAPAQQAEVEPDQLAFFNDLFGDQDQVPAPDPAGPTDTMRAAFSDVLANTKLPRSKWGPAVAERLDVDITQDQLEVLEREALDQGLLREYKHGGQMRLTREPKAKTEPLLSRETVTETVTTPEIAPAAPEVTGPQPIDTTAIKSVEDLTTFLKGYGIDTDAYGKNEAKSLNALLGELEKGESQLFDQDGKLVRRVSSLALDIYVTAPDGTRLKLYEDRQEFRDGRMRRRELDSSLGEKLEPGEEPQATIARALEEEIGVTSFTQTSGINSYSNSIYSPSYPGILGDYTTFRASVEIDPDQYQEEYVEEQKEKVNVMLWFPIEQGDERSPNIPGSPYNMERREVEARDYMQSGTYTFPEEGSAPKSLWGRTIGYQEATKTEPDNDTSQQPGYWSDEWKAKRRYNVRDDDGNPIEVGFDEAIDWLEKTFIKEAGGAENIARDRKAYIVIGLPGAGKSTLIDPMIKHVRAIHVVADETKKIIPEFQDGANSGGVHEESSDMTKLVQARLIDAGYNLVLEKIGGTAASIEKEINKAQENNYTPQLFMVDVPTPVAMERAIGRFRATGRAVGEKVYDADIRGVYNILKEREEVTGYGRFEWKEPDGWQWQETGSDDLRGFAFKDKFSGVRIAYDRDGGVRLRPVDGRDRYEVDDETYDPTVQGQDLQAGEPRIEEGPGEIPALVLSELTDNDFARERAEAAITAWEETNKEMASQGLLEDVLRVESARGSVEATQEAVNEIASDPGFMKADALRLASAVGYPPKSRTTIKQALDSIVERTRDMIDNREVAELITQEPTDVPSGGIDLEPDLRAGEPGDALGAADVPAARGRDDGGPGPGGNSARDGVITGEPGLPDSVGLFDGDAAAVGEPSNLPLSEPPPGSPRSATRDPDSGRSSDAREPGGSIEPVPAEVVSATATEDADLETAAERQAKADKIPVVPGDAANVAATLPDVNIPNTIDIAKAEQRFNDPNALPGFLITNGTGTGKTYLGLGLIKRLLRQGKENILIVGPSQGGLDNWGKEAKGFGIDVYRLGNKQEAGTGVTTTTYANLRDNTALATREWDLIIMDEAHHLSMNKSGVPTDALKVFRGITNKNPYQKAAMLVNEYHADLVSKEKLLAASAKDDNRYLVEAEAARAELAVLREQYRGETNELDVTNVLFLSATPFAYRKSTDYGEGFLFSYPEETGAYSQAGGQDAFLVENFGYNFRYGRAEEPGPEVNVSVLERQFHENMKKQGALSGRSLDVPVDYDRRFVLVDDAIGSKIDQAFEWMRENMSRYGPLEDHFRERFNYLAQRRLLEAIKANHVIPRIKKDMELGRKVVVFHDYIEGAGFNPFTLSESRDTPVLLQGESTTLGALYDEFVAANPYVKKLKFAEMGNPIETLTEAFPDALLYNGRIPVKKRRANRDLFNDDNSGKDLIIIQSDAGQAEISLHDKTNAHQRILYNLGLPTKPTAAIQQEGRIYRTGQVSDAIFRYMSTGTSWERIAFAQTIAERASTAENLAMGEQARHLRESFIDAFNDAEAIEQGADEGKGGKAKDRAGQSALTEYDRAKAFYFAQGKKKGKRSSREGIDYYATPEPVGFKMAEFADVGIGEAILEPSAGHGAISRWFSEGARRTLIEPSPTLASKAALSSPGAKVVQSTFEVFNIVNKFDGVVMNPPFGSGGKTAFEHVWKAARHLRDKGRIVALVPDGPAANKRREGMEETEEFNDIFTLLEIDMPAVMFERAGTSVRTKLIVYQRDRDVYNGLVQQPVTNRIDMSGIEDINELFDRLDNVTLDKRPRAGEERPQIAPAQTKREPASWVIKDKETGDVIAETFDKKKVDALNTENYEAVPIAEHLAAQNQDPATIASRFDAMPDVEFATTVSSLVKKPLGELQMIASEYLGYSASNMTRNEIVTQMRSKHQQTAMERARGRDLAELDRLATEVQAMAAPETFTEAGGQTSLVPPPTTQEQITAEAARREGPRSQQDMDIGGMFSDAINQVDLVDRSRARFASAAEAEAYFGKIIDDIGQQLTPQGQMELRRDPARAAALLEEVTRAYEAAVKVSGMGGAPMNPSQVIELDPAKGRPITGTLDAQKYEIGFIVEQQRERAERQAAREQKKAAEGPLDPNMSRADIEAALLAQGVTGADKLKHLNRRELIDWAENMRKRFAFQEQSLEPLRAGMTPEQRETITVRNADVFRPPELPA